MRRYAQSPSVLLSIAVALAALSSPVAAQTVATFPTTTTLPHTIPDNSVVGTTLDIPVSGLGGPPADGVQEVALNFSSDTPAGPQGHSWVGDIEMTLMSPEGSVHTIMSRTGSTTGTGAGDSSNLTGPYTFGDNETGDWWSVADATAGADSLPAGGYRTTENTSATPTDMDPVFFDEDGNGTWTVFISDNAGGDTGRISAMSLTLTTGTTPVELQSFSIE